MINIVSGVKKYADTDRLAVICKDETLSYKELDKFSDIIGNYLLNKYEGNTPICIYANKDRLILPCMIGALKSGRAYVPMDLSFPEQRVCDVVKSVNPNIVFDFSDGSCFFDEDGEKKREFEGIEIMSKDTLNELILRNIESDLSKPIDESNWVKDDENSYILFTSGSTGKPKGVQISTYNLDSFVEWMSPILGLDGSEKVVMDQPAYSFDLSVSQLYPGIYNGATLFSLPKDVISDFRAMFLEFKKSDIEVWVSTPSFVGMCLADREFDENMLPKMRKMLFIGEVLPVEVSKKIRERFPKVDIINGYGPTEATVGISHVIINDYHLENMKSLPVGVAMPNCTIKIVDDNGVEVKKGEKGEIVIIGPSVSKGYFNNEEKTKECFYVDKTANVEKVDIKLSDELNKLRFRAYKTGDLGSIADDGNIIYNGRKDFQIKLNGYRIEIEDIENNLRKVDNIRNGVVIPVFKDEKIAYLKAFVELEESNSLSNLKNQIAIKKALSKFIPEYMIPRNIVVVERLPMNTNGKIDRKKLSMEV